MSFGLLDDGSGLHAGLLDGGTGILGSLVTQLALVRQPGDADIVGLGLCGGAHVSNDPTAFLLDALRLVASHGDDVLGLGLRGGEDFGGVNSQTLEIGLGGLSLGLGDLSA